MEDGGSQHDSAGGLQAHDEGGRPGVSPLAAHLLVALRSHASAENAAGMARFGISPAGTLGVSMPVVRGLARDAKRELGRDTQALHALSAELWASGIHEARILSALVDAPALLTLEEADARVAGLDSWDVCDQLCLNLLRRTTFAWELPERWTAREETFAKRAGFVVAATLAVHEKSAPPQAFEPLLALCARECTDERNDVKKAVNWALRQIGKRDAECNALATACAERMLAAHPTSKPARWIARDALRELRSDSVRLRLGIAKTTEDAAR